MSHSQTVSASDQVERQNKRQNIVIFRSDAWSFVASTLHNWFSLIPFKVADARQSAVHKFSGLVFVFSFCLTNISSGLLTERRMVLGGLRSIFEWTAVLHDSRRVFFWRISFTKTVWGTEYSEYSLINFDSRNRSQGGQLKNKLKCKLKMCSSVCFRV